MRLIAIDPGFERVGVAIIDSNQQPTTNNQQQLVYSDCFRTSAKLPLAERVSLIGREVKKLIKKYKPEALAIEALYFTKNQKTAMAVAEARGAIIYECSRVGLEIFEYTPLQVKIAVTGYGKADKNQVMDMVSKLIKLPDKKLIDDELDAIAIGLTQLAHHKS